MEELFKNFRGLLTSLRSVPDTSQLRECDAAKKIRGARKPLLIRPRFGWAGDRKP